MTRGEPLTAPEIEKMIRAFADHERFCRESLRIRAKNGDLLPFILQPAQSKLRKAIEKQQAAGQPVRICYLKAGQVMVSSGTAAELFHAVPFLPGRHALAVADSDAHAELVFNYYKGFQDNFVPFEAIPDCRITLPRLVNDRSETLKWDNDSWIKCATGRNPHVGRSNPWQFVQFSEAAFINAFDVLMAGTMQRVPNSPDTMVVVESTAFGDSGPFYELCMRAMDPQRAGGWQFLFFAWWEHPEYQMPVPGGDRAAFQRDLSRDEREEMQRYGLSLEQMAWRRHKIQTDCGGRIQDFRQEMPANPREAFQGSAKTYLDMGAVERCCQIEPGTRGQLDDETRIGPQKLLTFRQRADDDMVVFRYPRKGALYTIGADSAQGKDPQAKKGGASDPDYAVACVVDLETGEQVAKYRARVTEAVFARYVYAMGQWYNWAYIVPEVVGAGRAFLQALIALQYPLDRIYRKLRPAGDFRPPQFNELGFETTTVTRPQLLSGLDAALLEACITIHDQQTAQELRTLVRHPDGMVAAKLDSHDDEVFGLALAIVGIKNAPRKALETRDSKAWRPFNYRNASQQDDEDDDD